MAIHVPIRYSEIFAGEKPDPKSLLLTVPKSVYQVVGPSLISIADPHNNFNDSKILRKYFCKENIEIRNAIIDIIQNQESRCFSNPVTAYKLMELYFQLPLKETVQLTEPEIELNFWKAYLLLNEEFNLKSNESVNNITGSINQKLIKHLITSINIHDIGNYNQRIVFLSQLIKSIRFFQFLESDTKFEPYLSKFLEVKKCSNYKEYLQRVLGLVAPALGQVDRTYEDIKIVEDENFEENNFFLESFSVNENHYKELPDFVGIRSSPLIKISVGHYRIVSLLFLIETLYKSIRFFITRPIHNLVKKSDQISIYSIISGEFSENIVLYEVLDRIISDTYIKIKGEDFKDFGIEESEPDYLAFNKNNILLFESKDVILQGEVKQSLDYNLIENGLKNKFHKVNPNGGGVGIPQLVENVLRICEGTYDDIIKIKNKNKVNIYPILVIHDRQFDTPGINKLLIKWFHEELLAERDNENISRVKDLTIINNDQLLALQHFLSTSKIDLKNQIDLYHKELNNSKKMIGADSNFLMKKFRSFSSYLEEQLVENHNLKPEKIFNEYVKELYK